MQMLSHYVHISVVTTYLQLQQMDSFTQNRKVSYRKQIARQQSRHEIFFWPGQVAWSTV